MARALATDDTTPRDDAMQTRAPATYDDVLAAPDHQRAELIDGVLYLSARPAEPHLIAATALGADLLTRFHGRDADGPGGWVVLQQPELWLGRPDPRQRVLVPDVAGWRLERYAANPQGVGYVVVPDWVCEVLSPSSVRHDRLRKLELYRAAGVAHAWIVDPAAETVEVFRLGERGPYELVASGSEGEARLPPFDAAPLRLDRWWRRGLGPAGA